MLSTWIGCFLAAAAIVVFGAKFIKTALDWILSMFKGAITVAAYGLITVRRGQGHNHPRMKREYEKKSVN
uniref:hypothetical protein n=1 Tax=Enterocloster clostridioformis TaxID=1531 RepID=UPI003A918849